MKTLLTLLIVGIFGACQVEPAAAPVKEQADMSKGYHPCLDAFTAALDTVQGCAELKAIFPNVSCFGCDFEAEGSYRDAVKAWGYRCENMQCEWCDKTPLSCD